MNRHVLVTGATGRVGPHVADALLEAGYRLSVATPDRPVHTPSAKWIPVDFATPVNYSNLLADVDVVVHMAAELWDTTKMESVNAHATASLAEAAENAQVGLMIYISTVAVYGFPSKHFVDEMTPTLPTRPEQVRRVPYPADDVLKTYAVTKLAGELELRRRLLGTRGVVLRLTNVVSERDIASTLQWTIPRRIWRGYRATHQVYVKDVAAAIEFFITKYFENGLRNLEQVELYVVSEDAERRNTYGDLFRRYDQARGAPLIWSRLSAPAWTDGVKDRIKFRRVHLGLPYGALMFSPAKLLRAGFSYRHGIVNVQNRVISEVVRLS